MKTLFKKALAFFLIISVVLCLGSCFLFEDNNVDENDSQNNVEPKPDPVEISLDLMSYNIRICVDTGVNAWDNRKANMVAYLNSQNADVICMQEVVTVQYQYIFEGVCEKYDIVYYERSGEGSEGLAIAFDKNKFDVVEQRMFWLSETPDEMSLGWGANYYRICVNVLLRHKETGAYLDVYNVHLDSESRDARLNGINLIMQKAEGRGYPIYLAGDFNDVIGSPCYQAIDGKLMDCQVYADETTEGTTWHNWGQIPDDANDSIDFCFVSEDIVPLKFTICRDKAPDGNFYSDHYAVKTSVKIIIEAE